MCDQIGSKELRDVLRRYGVPKQILTAVGKKDISGSDFCYADEMMLGTLCAQSPHLIKKLQRLQNKFNDDWKAAVSFVPEQQAIAAEALDKFYYFNSVDDKVGKAINITDSYSDEPPLLFKTLASKYPGVYISLTPV